MVPPGQPRTLRRFRTLRRPPDVRGHHQHAPPLRVGFHNGDRRAPRRAPSGAPEAELWLGAHPGSPSRVLDPDQTGGAADLAAWIAAAPVGGARAPHDGPQLPFLLKVLAAEHPLSLQAHPSAAQARAGYLREDEAGVPLDAPHRNYRDPYPKPEMIYALSDRFDALCGFRPVEESLDVLQGFVDLDVRGDTPQAGAALRPHGAAGLPARRVRVAARRRAAGGRAGGAGEPHRSRWPDTPGGMRSPSSSAPTRCPARSASTGSWRRCGCSRRSIRGIRASSSRCCSTR